jgi:hypothetical protein
MPPSLPTHNASMANLDTSCVHLLLSGPRKGKPCGAKRALYVERCDKHEKMYREQQAKKAVEEEEHRQALFLKEHGITWEQHVVQEEIKRRALENERLEAECQAKHGMSRREYTDMVMRRCQEEIRVKEEKAQEKEQREQEEMQARIDGDPNFIVRELEKYSTEAFLSCITDDFSWIKKDYGFEHDPEDERVIVLKNGRRLRITIKVVDEPDE